MFETAIILINYNSSYYTINCINSCIDKIAKNYNFQIVVVDNCSEIADYNKLESFVTSLSFSNIKLIRSKINTGFGGGNMIGIQHANAKYYAFVNNDSLLLNDCISIIIEYMKSNPLAGICGPLAYKEDGSILPTLDHFASPMKEFFGRKFLESINHKKYPNRKKIYTQPQRGQFVAGSFMVVKSDDFNQVGGFDTNIFLYYEETDLCIRLAKINKFAYLIPHAEFIHYHGVSTPQNIAIKTELKISFLYIIRKHYGIFWHQIVLNKLRIQFLLKSIFKPKYWHIFKVLLAGAPIDKSLKQKQKIIE
ncbi:glycosyltransferase family 2 protein [Flavobacterium sp.]|jgi:GT2 family glycosyltransferase|uniref:glycosyltransferase family 2 protein n=1 Tax=Flavobacterium sp. TaxID=239 RepID=UPI003BC08E51